MKPDRYNILLFKTNIHTEASHNNLKAILDQKPSIERWTIDMEDVDCVLRIVSKEPELEEIIRTVTRLGYECAELD